MVKLIHASFVSILLLVSTCTTAWASSITIDFTDPSIPEAADSFITEGYEFSFGPEPNPTPPYYQVLSPGLAYCAGCEVFIERQDGLSFNFQELDIYAYAGAPAGALFDIKGYTSGGDVLSQSINVDSPTTTYSIDWNEVVRVELTGIYCAFSSPEDGVVCGPSNSQITILNSITVSEVPIPAAVWLFGSALAGLGWIRRKQAA